MKTWNYVRALAVGMALALLVAAPLYAGGISLADDNALIASAGGTSPTSPTILVATGIVAAAVAGELALQSVPRAGSVHVAGEPVGLEQRCVRCGRLLVDYSNAHVAESRITEARPFFFRTASTVAEAGNGLVTYNLADGPPPAEDPLCTIAPRGTPGVH
jgi:hypothetical protein